MDDPRRHPALTAWPRSPYTAADGTDRMPIQRLRKAPPPPEHDQPPTESARPRRSLFWWKIGGSMIAVVVVFVALVGYRLLAAVNTTGNGNRRVTVLEQLTHLVANRDAQLRGEAQDRVNILLLGIGGAGHEGPLLTDTIILASVQPSTGKVTLLSIPRDLAVDIPRYGIRKINNANAFGKDLGYPGGGEQLAADIVQRVTGQTVHYFARIDFAGFVKIVDDLGGMTVEVERSFVDREYPTFNFGYQTVRFTAGRQTMDGATALEFVRSRHGNNGEGSDFARSRRQQLVLEAIRDRAFSLGTIVNPVRIGNVLGSLGAHTRTTMEVWEMLRLSRLVRDARGGGITNVVLESGPTGALKNATGIDGAFLLLPKDPSYRTIQAIASSAFRRTDVERESARVLITSAASRRPAAQQLAESLAALGFPAPQLETSRPDSPTTTRILDATNGALPASIQTIQSFLGLTASGLAPDTNENRNVPSVIRTGADIVIELGSAASAAALGRRAGATT